MFQAAELVGIMREFCVRDFLDMTTGQAHDQSLALNDALDKTIERSESFG